MVDVSTLKEPTITYLGEFQSSDFEGFKSEEASVFGARSCFSRDTSIELYKKAKEKYPNPEDFNESKEKTFKNTIGKAHLAALDPALFGIAMQDVPRMFTLVLCQDQYRMHLQQSLRRVNIKENDLYIPETLKNTELAKDFINLFNDNFELYTKMTEAGIHREIARGIFPLYLTTAIQTTSDSRGWWELFNSSSREEFPYTVENLANEVKLIFKEKAPRLFKDREHVQEILNYYPSSQLFWPKNESLKREIEKKGKLDKVVYTEYLLSNMTEEDIRKAIEDRDLAELANLKHIHFEMLWPMSIYTWHQSTRQRTLDHTVESIYDAAERAEIIKPKDIVDSEFIDSYIENSLRGLRLYLESVREGYDKKEVIGVIPHATIMFDKVHINGWNAMYMIGKRRCREAQGEIANIAKQSAKIIDRIFPELGRYAQPQGVIFGKCPEDKWDECGYCKGIVSKR